MACLTAYSWVYYGLSHCALVDVFWPVPLHTRGCARTVSLHTRGCARAVPLHTHGCVRAVHSARSLHIKFPLCMYKLNVHWIQFTMGDGLN